MGRGWGPAHQPSARSVSQACCKATDKCIVVNKYYSKCDTPTAEALSFAIVEDSCPGLEGGCPSEA